MSEGAEIPSTPPEPAAPATDYKGAFESSIPQDFNRDWLGEFKDAENPISALLSKYDSALESSRNSGSITPPQEGSSDADIRAYHTAIGVPENIDGYEYTPPDISSEPEAVQNILKQATSEEARKAVTEAAFKAGVPKDGLNKVFEAFDKFQIEQAKVAVEAEAKAMKERQEAFDKALDSMFPRGQRDASVTAAKATMQKVVPAEVLAHKDPELTAYYLLDYIQKNVFKEGRVNTSPSAGLSRGPDEIHSEIKALRSNPKFKESHTRDGAELQAKVQELYREMAAAKKDA